MLSQLSIVLMSDNGPQFNCKEMEDFAEAYNFKHVTSSPLYPQSNGLAEWSVRTVKELLRNAEDICLALLAYRAIPLPWCHLSPTELLMGRRVRTNVPQIAQQFVPEWPYLQQFKAADKRYKKNLKEAFDTRRVLSLPELDHDLPLWVNMQNGQVPGSIVCQANTPHSYHVNVPSGQVRRNRRSTSSATISRQHR